MKLNRSQSNVQSGGMNLKVHYKIEANVKSFDVLSGGMYSHIIPTIVRELSSNAFDAHREAGKAEVPFTVGCPTGFDPYFTVDDEGTGLRYYKFSAKIRNDASNDVEGDITSTVFIKGDIRQRVTEIDTIILTQNGISQTLVVPSYLYDKSKDETCFRLAGEFHGDSVTVEFDDTLVLYSTYFKSTKEQTDDYIGGYGLGAKTPLAYTDNFMVTNRFEGTERTYTIFKDETGMPCISLMGMNDTTKPNGMEIKMGVDPSDYNEFKEAIEDQLKFFMPQPNVLNDVVDMPEVLHVGENFLLMDTDNRNSGYGYYRKSSASVGFNAYDIKYVDSTLFGEKLALRFNIGEVMVTASREELKYDDTTIEMIKKREADALFEYRNYVLDTLVDTAKVMTDYEKAEFLNDNSSVLDLSDDRVKELVGNPHYKYNPRNILIPITGWGDYTTLRYTEDYEYDGDGKEILVGTSYKPHMSHTTRMLTWSTYDGNNRKSKKVDTGNTQYISPNENVLVFIRDNSFSFLKKIGYYIEENEISTHDCKILILDMFHNSTGEVDALSILKSLIGHTTTFVRLSKIVLPKNISLKPIGRYTTPIARLFNPVDHSFRTVKYWDDVYTPLTKIDRDAYIIETHRCNIENMGYDDQSFITEYINAKFEWDESITILALSRARYEKALTYGFKPISELVETLKDGIEITVDAVHSNILENVCSKISNNNIYGLLGNFSQEQKSRIVKSSDLAKLIRIRNVIHNRYLVKSSKFKAINRIYGYIEPDTLPEPFEIVKRMVDIVNYICYNNSKSLPLVDSANTWEFSADYKIEALIDYINLKHEQTQEFTL